MIRVALLLVVLTGCDALFNLDHVAATHDGGDELGDGHHSDGQLDDSGPDGSICVGRFLSICPTFAAASTFNTDATINTTNDSRCTVITGGANYPDICVIAADSITINAKLTITGTRALALVSRTGITVTSAGQIIASSARSGLNVRLGPAANASFLLGCNLASGEQQIVVNGGAGGGGGGSFHGTGGAGGTSDSGTTVTAAGMLSAPPTKLRGGCAGSQGGTSANTNVVGPLGNSGGALYLDAATSLSIAGLVLANGSGGGGAPINTLGENSGGGGGGSGGMIVLDGSAIVITGYVVALGGGGGGGGEGASYGGDGGEWSALTPTSGGAGGLGGGNARGGGAASSPTVVDGSGGGSFSGQGGAGGGGGASGFILTYGTVSQASHVYPSAIAVQ